MKSEKKNWDFAKIGDSCRNMRQLQLTDYTELCKSIIETIMTKKDVNKTKVKKILMGSKTEKNSADYKDYGKFRREKGLILIEL